MGFKDMLKNLGERARERKERIKAMDEDLRLQRLVEDRQKSSNERELEKFMREERESEIKEALNVMRKKREKDIAFGHNPLNVRNITNHTDWEVLKERNQFKKNKFMFAKQKSVLNNNPSLLRNNMRLMK